MKTTLFVCFVWAEFNLSGLPNIAIHVSGFHGKDGGIMELNVMPLAVTAFSYG
jgi:hypothetical protein